MTLPGVIARLRPTSNFDMSDWRIFSSPPPASMSSASIWAPRTRFSALLFRVVRSSSGLVKMKLDGALRIRVPVFGYLAEGPDGVCDLVGIANLLGAVLARPEIGRNRAAT